MCAGYSRARLHTHRLSRTRRSILSRLARRRRRRRQRSSREPRRKLERFLAWLLAHQVRVGDDLSSVGDVAKLPARMSHAQGQQLLPSARSLARLSAGMLKCAHSCVVHTHAPTGSGLHNNNNNNEQPVQRMQTELREKKLRSYCASLCRARFRLTLPGGWSGRSPARSLACSYVPCRAVRVC